MNKQHIPLIVGLSIPVLLVLVLAGVIFFPRAFVQPQYDFVYVVGDYPTYVDVEGNRLIEYTIVNESLREDVSPYDVAGRKPYLTNDPQFYRYDVSEHTNTLLTKEEVTALRLDPVRESPDGFVFNYARGDDNIFEAVFGGRDYSQRVLEKGSVTVNLKVVAQDDYRGIGNFVGWVVGN